MRARLRRLPHVLLLCGLSATAPAAFAEVFINELHYDNAGADVGEAVEIVATAGENLSGYRVWLYNGSNAPNAATTYGNVAVPAAQTRNCGASVGMATVTWPRDGLQNGPNDGIALVDGAGNVVQFISYEGTIVAGNGPAAGLTSQNLPVSESATAPVGTSLQLTGNGSTAADFVWAPSSTQTFGACNAGQTFGGSGGGSDTTAPSITATSPASGASDFPAAGDLSVSFSEAVTLANGAFALQCATSGAVTLDHASTGSTFAIGTGTALHAGEACTLTVNATAVSDAAGLSPAANAVIAFNVASSGGGGDSGDYYARVNTSSPGQLRCSLHATIRGHTSYPYSGGTTNTWTILEIADEDPTDSGKILDVYRNRSYAKGSGRAGTGSGLTYNREHTWPKSLGFPSTSGDKGLPNAPHTDAHMLSLSDTDHNSARGNKPLADCTASANCSERATEANQGVGGGTGLFPGNSNWTNTSGFQVWGHRKGDIARAVLYMAIRYEGGAHPTTRQGEPDLELTDDRSRIVSTSASPAYMGLLSTLLAWHQADPPDARERERNEVVYSFQGNRNPFIDQPQWATRALFESTTPASCQLLN
ncbi:endonuclease [Luteimonas fraxinea]|uniref:Endonuclease n=1 Tax=Luteimonas fraxinea TaxID=2901869 RepID=A0ABS8UD98_9GAMM|nr:endonuclease [Luteimonas fraxinea]MCD9097476.1 endonuclease [Luteimonas fraxinea]MCD9124966.1 endonuclease [Luteimonas fraxinea]UHH11729.1 endonuclease [Luteimonas fraxinea]